ncbi:MAG: ribonuclease III domain-containing protein [Methanoregula sp.]|nr:ribonuclease III domain-containing protein [Methanoregula sp.]
MDPAKIQELEKRLGHPFKEKKELYRALTHSTFSKEEKDKTVGGRDCPHQATYATLGDAILKAGFVWLLLDMGVDTKGDITIFKTGLEKNLKLAEVGKRLCLLEDNLIRHRMGTGEQLEKGTKKLCSDTVEALIGAIFVDTGHSLPRTKICISKIFAPELEELERKYHL